MLTPDAPGTTDQTTTTPAPKRETSLRTALLSAMEGKPPSRLVMVRVRTVRVSPACLGHGHAD